MTDLKAFIRESNLIEGIEREPSFGELRALDWFLRLPIVEVHCLKSLVHAFQPDAKLRNKPGMDVQVGSYIAPPGSHYMEQLLEFILSEASKARADPYQIHVGYENLHPFTDGNGRSGRALWLWIMEHGRGGAPLGFLHTFYYQTLAASKE